jgi:hypothetical protein
MNVIKIKSAFELQEIITSPIMITGDPRRDCEETYHNMWGIMLHDRSVVKNVSLQELYNFMKAVIKNRELQIQISAVISPIIFYLWVNDNIGRLCFNILSCREDELPFGCTVHIVNSLEQILQQFLDTPYHGGSIPMEDIIECELGDDDDDEDLKSYVLDVYTVDMSTNIS